MGDSHRFTGVISGSLVAVAAGLDPGKAVAFIAITTVSALLPDMDHPGATLPRMLGWPGRALAARISAVVGHRTLTHSVLGIGLLVIGLAFVPGIPAFCLAAVVLGCLTHIIGDMITVSGVPLFWPHKREFRIGRMRAGGQFETLVMTPLLAVGAVVSLAWLVRSYA
jgi:inner membrane protein